MKNMRLIITLLAVWALSTCVIPRAALAQDGGISSITFDQSDDNFDVDDDDAELIIKDPYEKYNRFMFKVNNSLYKNLFSPLSRVYDAVIPRFVQKRFNNFIRVVSTPKRFFNNIFQKKPKGASIELGRLLINSTLGIGGLFDPAKSFFKLEQQTEDFGQTLGSYGMDAGTFIIWPIVGPSTTRDSFGLAVDTAFSPFLWLGIYEVHPEDAFRAISAAKRVNNYTYNVRDGYKRIIESAIDPYIALQNAYIQNRQKRIDE